MSTPPIVALCDRILNLVAAHPGGCSALWLHLQVAGLDDEADETLLAIEALTRAGLLAVRRSEICAVGHRGHHATLRAAHAADGCRTCGRPVRAEVVYTRRLVTHLHRPEPRQFAAL